MSNGTNGRAHEPMPDGRWIDDLRDQSDFTRIPPDVHAIPDDASGTGEFRPAEYVQFSTVALVWRIFLLMFIIDTFFAGAIVAYALLNPPVTLHPYFILGLWGVHTVKFVVLVYAVIRGVASWSERRVMITGHHLFVRRGILRKKEQLFELKQLRSIALRQGWIARRLGFGTITCTFTASGYTETVQLDAVQNPQYYEQLIGTFLT
jgi:membrane protein YdbS with pleckstrin-like domain